MEDFKFPIGFHLDENNRWVILSRLIPWQQLEEEYAAIFEPNRAVLGWILTPEEEQRQRAQQEQQRAQQEQQRAEEQRQRVEQEQQRAEEQRQRAEAAQKRSQELESLLNRYREQFGDLPPLN